MSGTIPMTLSVINRYERLINPVDTVLTITKLHEMNEKLKPASCHWLNIGLALDIDYNSLNNLRVKYHHDSDACLREMLVLRLQSGGSLTWRMLCIALKSATVGRNDLAAQLEEYATSEILYSSLILMHRHTFLYTGVSVTQQEVSPSHGHIEQVSLT